MNQNYTHENFLVSHPYIGAFGATTATMLHFIDQPVDEVIIMSKRMNIA